jgi:hypothetical protein
MEDWTYSFTILDLCTRREWSVSSSTCFLPFKEEPPVPIKQEAVGAPEPVWTMWSRETCLSLAEN